MDVDPSAYPQLHIVVDGAVRARAFYEDRNIRVLLGMLAALAIVPLVMGIAAVATGSLHHEVGWLIYGGVALAELLLLTPVLGHTRVTLGDNSIRWMVGPFPVPWFGSLRRDEISKFRLQREGGMQRSDGTSTRMKHRLVAHREKGGKRVLGTFGSEKNAKQLLGICRAWQDASG